MQSVKRQAVAPFLKQSARHNLRLKEASQRFCGRILICTSVMAFANWRLCSQGPLPWHSPGTIASRGLKVCRRSEAGLGACRVLVSTYWTSVSSVSFNFTAFGDSGTGIRGYEWGLGSGPNMTNVVAFRPFDGGVKVMSRSIEACTLFQGSSYI